MHIFLIISLFAVWSLAFPLGKYLLEFSPPIFLTSVRMLLAGSILLAWMFFRNKVPKVSWRQWLALSILALFSIYLTNILEFWGLHRLSAAKACFFYSLSPMLAAILSYIHFKEKLTPIKIAGLVIGFLGFTPALFDKCGAEQGLHAFFLFSWPELAIAGAALFSVYGWVILRMVVKNDEISPVFANGCSMMIGGILALGTSYLVDPWNPIPVASGAWERFALVLLLLTFISNILCYNFYGFLLKRYTATLLSFFGLFSPLFTSIHEWIFLGVAPSIYILSSTAIVISGLWLYYKGELKQGYLPTNSR